jgi:sugar phosphate permease
VGRLLRRLAGAFANSYHTLYLLSLGASSAQIGLVSTLSQLAAGMSIPGAMIADRTGRYKQVVLRAGILNRLMWPLMVLSPLILIGPAAVWVSMLALVGISAFGNLGQPAWAALSAEFVPSHMRGGYFASRNIAIQIVQLAAIPWPAARNYVGEPAGFQINFMLAFAISWSRCTSTAGSASTRFRPGCQRTGRVRAGAGLLPNCAACRPSCASPRPMPP